MVECLKVTGHKRLETSRNNIAAMFKSVKLNTFNRGWEEQRVLKVINAKSKKDGWWTYNDLQTICHVEDFAITALGLNDKKGLTTVLKNDSVVVASQQHQQQQQQQQHHRRRRHDVTSPTRMATRHNVMSAHLRLVLSLSPISFFLIHSISFFQLKFLFVSH